MIFGVSHITLSCTDIDTGAGILRSAGFNVDFLDRHVPNFSGKAGFLEEYNKDHSLALCTGGGGAAVELVQHRVAASSTYSPMAVVFEGTVTEALKTRAFELIATSYLNLLEDIFDRRPGTGMWKDLSAFYYFNGADPDCPLKVKAIVQPVTRLEEAERFWCGHLKAKVVKRGMTDGQGWIHLRFAAAVPQWSAEFILVEQESLAPYPLDSTGFVCPVFLCNLLDKHVDDIQKEFDVRLSGTFDILVNRKLLRVQVLNLQFGGYIELIEILQV